MVWSVLWGKHDYIAVGAWQLVAWPLLAGVSLATIGPPLLALPRSVLLPRHGALVGIMAGASLTAGASYLLLAQPSGPGLWALCWLLACLGAAVFQVVGYSLKNAALQAPKTQSAA
jgi:hypothetical protein